MRSLTFFLSNKAASDGAISFYLDHVVTTRVSKLTYGAFGSVLYSKNDPEHRQRLAATYTNLQGTTWVPDRFTVILPKVRPRFEADPALFSR